MDAATALSQIRIASPCRASWAEMDGNARSRFCSHCQKHVYNIAALSAAEVTELIEQTEGQFCARLYRRRDGMVLTADCPVGAEAASRGRFRRFAARSVVALAGLLAATGLMAMSPGPRTPNFTPPPMGPGVTFRDWVDWALELVGLRSRPGGVLCNLNGREAEPFPCGPQMVGQPGRHRRRPLLPSARFIPLS